MHERMSLPHVLREGNCCFAVMPRQEETHRSAGWIIELATAPDTAPNGGFTMRSARSGGPS